MRRTICCGWLSSLNFSLYLENWLCNHNGLRKACLFGFPASSFARPFSLFPPSLSASCGLSAGTGAMHMLSRRHCPPLHPPPSPNDPCSYRHFARYVLRSYTIHKGGFPGLIFLLLPLLLLLLLLLLLFFCSSSSSSSSSASLSCWFPLALAFSSSSVCLGFHTLQANRTPHAHAIDEGSAFFFSFRITRTCCRFY